MVQRKMLKQTVRRVIDNSLTESTPLFTLKARPFAAHSDAQSDPTFQGCAAFPAFLMDPYPGTLD
jgi:hypothetical protein